MNNVIPRRSTAAHNYPLLTQNRSVEVLKTPLEQSNEASLDGLPLRGIGTDFNSYLDGKEEDMVLI